MNNRHLNRRDFNRLSAAALAGTLTGILTGCDSGKETTKETGKKDPVEKDANPPGGAPKKLVKADVDSQLLAEEPHVCCGLNTCKGKGRDGKNACLGQGSCYVVKRHVCNGKNDCKGKGGCGDTAGQNKCDGKGACAVPLREEDTWPKARAAFEKVMAAKGKKVGKAPEKCGKKA